MQQFSHKSHKQYRDAQITKNKRKLSSVWVREKDVKMLSEKFLKDAKFGICHGSRIGAEVKWFQKYTNAEVLGTDIAPTANYIPSMIQWDYHKTKNEWIGTCDFIFSNSLDHSYDPVKCAKKWLSCLNQHGVCIVEWWDSSTEDMDEADCLHATLEEYMSFFDQPGYAVELLEDVSDFRGYWVIAQKNKNVSLL